MRILLVGSNYAPEETGIAPYTTGIAEHFAGHGHAVTVLTGFPSYPESRVYDGYGRLPWKREAIRGVSVRRRWRSVGGAGSAAGRALSEATSLLSGLSAMAFSRPDVILAVVPALSDGLLARLLAARFSVPYGLVFQDLIGPAAEQAGVGAARRVAPLIRIAESWMARGASAVGIIADGFRPYVESLGVAPANIRRLRNWTHISTAAHGRAQARERLAVPRGAVLCLHAGNVGRKQGLENVVECARLAARSDPRLFFVLVGEGNRMKRIESMVAGYALPNLRLLPLQPGDLFPSVLGAADILLLNQRGSVVEMSLPSKLTSYFAACRPVVAAVDARSEAAREVEASGGGIVVAPDEPKALLATLTELADNPERGRRLGAAGHAWSQAALSPAAAMAQYDDLLKTIAGSADLRHSGVNQPVEAGT